MSARIIGNRFKTVKLWPKHDHKGSFVKVLKQQGLNIKKRTKLGLFFKRLGRRVDYGKIEGFFCKNAKADRFNSAQI